MPGTPSRAGSSLIVAAWLTALLGDRAVSAGATRVLGIYFELKDRSGAMAQARSLALENVRAKAEQLARRAGPELGRPIAISENDTDGVIPLRLAAPPPRRGLGTPILSGEIDVRTSVRTLWAVE